MKKIIILSFFFLSFLSLYSQSYKIICFLDQHKSHCVQDFLENSDSEDFDSEVISFITLLDNFITNRLDERFSIEVLSVENLKPSKITKEFIRIAEEPCWVILLVDEGVINIVNKGLNRLNRPEYNSLYEKIWPLNRLLDYALERSEHYNGNINVYYTSTRPNPIEEEYEDLSILCSELNLINVNLPDDPPKKTLFGFEVPMLIMSLGSLLLGLL